jgi:hypothetical protein
MAAPLLDARVDVTGASSCWVVGIAVTPEAHIGTSTPISYTSS